VAHATLEVGWHTPSSSGSLADLEEITSAWGALVQHRPAHAPAGPQAPGRGRGRVLLPAGKGRRVSAARPRYAGPVKGGGGGGCAAAHLPGFAGPSRARGWKRGQAPRPAPARRTARRPRRGGRLRRPGRQGSSELAFDGQKKRRNYTNPGPGSRPGNLITAEPPGEAASHKTRCA